MDSIEPQRCKARAPTSAKAVCERGIVRKGERVSASVVQARTAVTCDRVGLAMPHTVEGGLPVGRLGFRLSASAAVVTSFAASSSSTHSRALQAAIRCAAPLRMLPRPITH